MNNSIESIDTAIEEVRELVNALNQPRGSVGTREWIMSIPVRESDPDRIIYRLIRAAMRAKEEIVTKDARIAELENALRGILPRAAYSVYGNYKDRADVSCNYCFKTGRGMDKSTIVHTEDCIIAVAESLLGDSNA